MINLYKRAGAEYLVALATHHDNFDCWNSKYQPWNCVNVGPKRDIVGTWAKDRAFQWFAIWRELSRNAAPHMG